MSGILTEFSDAQSFPFLPLLGKVENREMSKIAHLAIHRQDTPSTVNGKVTPPRRCKNQERRNREYLTPYGVEHMITTAGSLGRHDHWDRTLIMLAYRHACGSRSSLPKGGSIQT